MKFNVQEGSSSKFLFFQPALLPNNTGETILGHVTGIEPFQGRQILGQKPATWDRRSEPMLPKFQKNQRWWVDGLDYRKRGVGGWWWWTMMMMKGYGLHARKSSRWLLRILWCESLKILKRSHKQHKLRDDCREYLKSEVSKNPGKNKKISTAVIPKWEIFQRLRNLGQTIRPLQRSHSWQILATSIKHEAKCAH